MRMKLCKTTSPLISCDRVSSEYSCAIMRTLKRHLMTPKMHSITLRSCACLLLNNSSGVCGLCDVTITVTVGAVDTLVHTYCCSNPIPSNGTSLHSRGLEVHLSLHTQHRPVVAPIRYPEVFVLGTIEYTAVGCAAFPSG